MKNTIKLLAMGGLVLHVLGMDVQAGLGVNWATPSGLVRTDGSTPLLENGSALFQLVYAGFDNTADPPTADGGVSGDDVLWGQQVVDASTAGSYGQHFAATYVDLAWSTAANLYVRIYDRGTSIGNVPAGTAYFQGALVAADLTWGWATTYQEVPEGPFAGGPSADGFGRYVLDQQVGGGPQPDPPALDVTNANETVAHSVSNRIIGGTSSNLTGQIRWTNSLNGASGSIPAAASWSLTGALAVGTNVITASGTNSAGEAATDSVTIIRVSAPTLDVTTENGLVRYSVTSMTVEGTIGNGTYIQLSWTNSLTGAGGVAYADASPENNAFMFGVALDVGANLITVRGSNLYGDVVSDSVTITRGGIGTDLPAVDITDANQTVAYAVSNFTVGGMANPHVIGQIVWSNSLGGAGSFAAAANWSFSAPLAEGANTITVRGTNLWGETSTDVVVLTRAASATEPYLDITNANETVENSVSSRVIGGISSNLTGLIRWTNSLNGLTGTLAAAPAWSFACPLAVGSNPITVWGTNSAGQVASGTVTVLRADPQGEVIIFQPGPGLNDGSDDGRAGAGKDANGGNCNGSGSNEGDAVYLYADPISDCNPCHSKMFIQFNLDALPLDVTAVYLGFTHIPQTDYCLSNCEADFYFYPLTGPWNEMTVSLDNQPARGSPIHGPVHRAFPNDPGTQEYEITEIYREWKNGTTPNHGLEISSETIGCNNAAVAFYVHSSDAEDPGKRPYLRVLTGLSPYLAITNGPATVANSVSEYTLGGIANTQLVGQITWSNSLGGSGTIPATTNWEITVPLSVGPNLITVSGTNLLGETASSQITILRAEAVSMLALDKVFYQATPPDPAGHFQVSYILSVHNAGKTDEVYDLTDLPAPDENLTILGGAVSGQASGTLAGAGPYILADDEPIAVGATHTYTLVLDAQLSMAVIGGFEFVSACEWIEGEYMAGRGLFNAATLSYGPGPTLVTASDCGEVPPLLLSGIEVEKTADPLTYSAAGNVITYSFTVRNTGNVTLTNIMVTDPLVAVVGGPIELGPGAEDATTFTASYLITQADVDAGQVVNFAAASGEDPTGARVEDNDDETVTADQVAAIELTKTASPETYSTAGDAITYSFTVRNNGNVTLNNVMVTDPLFGLAFGPISLMPGASQTFNHVHQITPADLGAGSLMNTATASGQDPDGNPVEDQDQAMACRNLFMTPPPDLIRECTDDVGTNSTGVATAGSGCGCLITLTHEDTIAPGACTQGYTLQRVWRAEDDCANLIIHTQLITVVDAEAPVLPELPEGGDLGCNPVLPSCVDTLLAGDNCDGEVPVVCEAGAITGDDCAKSQVFTYTATDDCGNAASDTVTYTWKVDMTPPVLPVLPEGGDLGCNPVPPSCVDTLLAVDNCDGEVPVVCEAGAITGDDCAKSQVFTYTATDDCGNASGATVTYTWKVDMTPPVLPELPEGGDLGCNPLLPSCVDTLLAVDNCDGEVPVVCEAGAITGDDCAKNQVFTYTATDACGNAASDTVTYTWKVDATPPVLPELPEGGDLGCNPVPPSCVDTLLAVDNCDGEVPVVCEAGAITGDDCAKNQVFTYTATDACGNAASDTVTYTWKVDMTPPVLPELPEGGDLGENPPPPSCAEGLMASDNCAGEVPVVCVAGEITGVGNDKSQTFTYTATDACGNSATDTVTYTWKVVLMAPSDLVAVATSLSRIQLNWTDNNWYETGYAIERRSSVNAVWVPLITLPANAAAFEDTGLAAGQTYFYRVFAINPDGTSPASTEVSATTPGVPAPPANLTAVAQATNQIGLTWTDAADNETGFELQRKIGAAGAWSGAAVLPANAQSHLDSGLAPNTLYYYRLRATNAVGASGFSSEAGASTLQMPEDPDCTYEITVTATNLTVDGGSISLPAIVPDNAIIGGTIGIRQTSPRSLGAVQRVAMGFRDQAGLAAGQPREMFLLQGVPGCPGRSLATLPLPTDMRAPASAGTYHLWVESFISPLDPVIAFQSTVRTNLDNLAKRLGLFTVQPRPFDQVQVRILPASGLRSEPVMMQVLVVSTGGVNSVGFTVTYDPAIVAHPRVLPGADAPAIWPVVNTAMDGRIGVLLLMPGDESLPSGTVRLADIWFDPVTNGISALTFADVPVPREVAFVDPEVAPTVEWIGGSVAILMLGYEADLDPRPGGDSAVTEADVLMMQLFVAGIEPPASSNEYRKADCSPRGTSGNGRLDVSDLRQAIRYRNGLDPLQPEDGPWASTNGMLSRGASPGATPKGESDRTMTATDQTVTRGDTFWLAIELAAQGNESTLGFSLEFDPALLTYLDVRKVGAASGSTLVPSLNNLAEGRLGFALAMPGAEVLPAGKATILEVAFASVAGNSIVVTPVAWSDSPVTRSCADVDAVPLPVAYAGATITLQPIVAPGAPEVPMGLTAEATSTNQIHLAWNDASDNESGFQVLRRTGVQPWSAIAVLAPDVETYSDVGLAPDQAYRYQVAAFNGIGSGFSDEAEATTWSRRTAWRLAKFGTTLNDGAAADAGDWDDDGIPNQIEYGMGTDPANELDPASAWIMQVRDGVQIGTDRFLTAIYELGPDAAPDMVVRMQVNPNLLLPWTTFMLPVDDTPAGGRHRIRVRSDQPLDQRRQEYLRMNVSPTGN